jgi:hypothetical protein
MDGTSGEDHLASRPDCPRDLPADDLYPAGAIAIEQDFGGIGV